MTSMGQHSEHSAAGAPLRRAHFTAWAVFLGMAGTSMVFQVFHSIHVGHMPWPLAYLYGIVPLAVSVGVLEVAAKWQSKGAKAGAWLVTAGAMFLSAFATGAVTASAAPPHAELLFGAVLDAAALLTVRFILDGPRAAHAVAAVAKREAELLGQAAAERSAREQAQAAHEAAEASLRADAEAALEAQREAHAAALRDLRDARDSDVRAMREDLDAERAARESAEQDAERRASAETERDEAVAAMLGAQAAAEAAEGERTEAQRAAAENAAKAETLTRKLARAAGANGRKPTAGEGRKNRNLAVPNDFDAQAAALAILADEPDISGAKLAERVGMSERWGQAFKKQLVTRPAGGETAGE